MVDWEKLQISGAVLLGLKGQDNLAQGNALG